jgi:hypothetical protein
MLNKVKLWLEHWFSVLVAAYFFPPIVFGGFDLVGDWTKKAEQRFVSGDWFYIAFYLFLALVGGAWMHVRLRTAEKPKSEA